MKKKPVEVVVYGDSEITIDKDVPIPPGNGRGASVKYPYHLLEVGDSFLYPEGFKEMLARRYTSLQSVKMKPKKFSARKVEDGRIRVWRVE